MSIAHRKSIDYFRRLRVTLPLEVAENIADTSSEPEEILEQQLCIEKVAAFLNYLTPERAEAIALRIFGGLSASEVGVVMGKSEVVRINNP